MDSGEGSVDSAEWSVESGIVGWGLVMANMMELVRLLVWAQCAERQLQLKYFSNKYLNPK